jgi:hypothetical protein
MFLLLAGVLLARSAHPFLAVTSRLDANILVVEGWVHKYAIQEAVKEFNTGFYQRVFATGGPVTGNGGYTSDYQTSAHVGASGLEASGVPKVSVQMVPSRVIGRDRTYNSAVALRNWFRENNISVGRINVLTEDAHARRTRLLFQKALGKGVRVGVISIKNPDYDPKRWWQFSEGVREVIGESLAYLYARFLFHPTDAP